MNTTESQVHISDIRAGDTVMHHGVMRTVCRSDITHSKFMGVALFGDTYRLGQQTVTRVNIIKAK